MKFLQAIAAFAICACASTPLSCPVPPKPEPVLVGDAGPPLPASVACEAACANLKQLGCSSGLDPACGPTCDSMLAHPNVVTVDPACATSAATKASAAACGFGCE